MFEDLGIWIMIEVRRFSPTKLCARETPIPRVSFGSPLLTALSTNGQSFPLSLSLSLSSFSLLLCLLGVSSRARASRESEETEKSCSLRSNVVDIALPVEVVTEEDDDGGGSGVQGSVDAIEEWRKEEGGDEGSNGVGEEEVEGPLRGGARPRLLLAPSPPRLPLRPLPFRYRPPILLFSLNRNRTLRFT